MECLQECQFNTQLDIDLLSLTLELELDEVPQVAEDALVGAVLRDDGIARPASARVFEEVGTRIHIDVSRRQQRRR